MNLYLIKRTDEHDYDEYDSILVRASDPARAVEMATATHESWDSPLYSGFKPDGSNLKVEEVRLRGPEGLIIGSFNAG